MLRENVKQLPPFKVGLNEGIIIKRELLSKREMRFYTDSLRGCAAVVVATDTHVFMAHVYSGWEGNLLDNAKNYLQAVLKRMNELHTEEYGREIKKKTIQFGVAATDGGDTYNAFVKACEYFQPKVGGSNSSVTKKKKTPGGKVCVNFATSGSEHGQIILDHQFSDPSPLNRIGSSRCPELIADMIPATAFGFGGGLSHGDFDEDFDRNFSDGWKIKPKLRNSAIKLIKVTGNDYSYVGNDLLRFVDKKINEIPLIMKIRFMVCEEFTNLLRSKQVKDIETEIAKITKKVIRKSLQSERQELKEKMGENIEKSLPIWMGRGEKVKGKKKDFKPF